MSKRTPGPWEAASNLIRTVPTADEQGGGMQGGFLVAEVPVNQDRHADARLIAAAPELLNALRELQANPNDPRAHRVAFGAIAKATGESA